MEFVYSWTVPASSATSRSEGSAWFFSFKYSTTASSTDFFACAAGEPKSRRERTPANVIIVLGVYTRPLDLSRNACYTRHHENARARPRRRLVRRSGRRVRAVRVRPGGRQDGPRRRGRRSRRPGLGREVLRRARGDQRVHRVLGE